MSDEAKLLAPSEARLRRRARETAKKDQPKTFIDIKKVDPGAHKFSSRKYIGKMGTKVRGQPQNVVGVEMRYFPSQKKIDVQDVFPYAVKRKPVEGILPHAMTHPEFKGKMLPKPTIRKLVEKTAVAFPKAETLFGRRVTGAHAVALRKALETGKYMDPEDVAKKAVQSFDLTKVRKRLARGGKYGKLAAAGLTAAETFLGPKK